MATKIDLSVGTPLLGIIDKSMDVWLEIFTALPEDKKADIAIQAANNLLFFERFLDRLGDRLFGKEGE